MTMNIRNLTAVVLTLLCVSISSATIVQTGPGILLQDLIDGTATLTSGDKTFEDFNYAGTGDVPDASLVNVIPIEDCDGNFGIRFQGAFLDLPGGGASDALISYTVVAPGPMIIGADLFANTTVSGSGLVQISETFLPDFTDISLNVFDNGTVTQLGDSVMLDTSADYMGPVTRLPVQKDILLLADDNGGVAGTVSLIDQIYHQVPEPSAFSLVLIGLVGMIRRRK